MIGLILFFYKCLVYTFQTEFWVCGVSPLNENLVLLGCLKDTQGERPQLHIVKPEEDDYTDLIIDSLSLRGFQKYTASEYSLGMFFGNFYFQSCIICVIIIYENIYIFFNLLFFFY